MPWVQPRQREVEDSLEVRDRYTQSAQAHRQVEASSALVIGLLIALILAYICVACLLLGTSYSEGPEAECLSYCQTYWASNPAQGLRCVEDCGR